MYQPLFPVRSMLPVGATGHLSNSEQLGDLHVTSLSPSPISPSALLLVESVLLRLSYWTTFGRRIGTQGTDAFRRSGSVNPQRTFAHLWSKPGFLSLWIVVPRLLQLIPMDRDRAGRQKRCVKEGGSLYTDALALCHHGVETPIASSFCNQLQQVARPKR
jgi:hypothetical protein